MANRSLGTLTVDLIAKVGGFVEGMSKAERETKRRSREIERSFNKIRTAVTVATTAAAASLAYMVKQSINTADQMAKTSQSIGVSAQEYQALTYAADLAGVSNEQLATAVRALNRSMLDAQRGLSTQKEGFAALGIEVQDAEGNLRDAIDVLKDISDVFSTAEDGAGKTGIALQLMGRQGAALVPLLNSGRDSIESLMQQASELGLVLSDEALRGAEQFNDSLTTLGYVQDGIANQIASEMLPYLNELSGLLVDLSTNSNLAADAAYLFGGGLKVLASFAIGVGAVVGKIADEFRALSAAIKAIGSGDFGGAVDALGEQLFNFERFEEAYARMADLWNGDFRQAGEAAAEVTNEITHSIRAQTDAEREATGVFEKGKSAVDRYVESLTAQLVELKEGKDAADDYRLSIEGATQAQLEYIEALRRQVDIARANVPPPDEEFGPGADVTARIIEDWLAAGEQSRQTVDQMSVFTEQAARNMQDAFADFLFNPFDEGLDGMLKSFANTLQRLAAEAAASKIFDAIFSGTTGGLGGILSGIFGGAEGRASGGPVMAGSVYQVGEFNRPELLIYGNRQYLIPGDSGRVVPAGGGGNTQIFNITTPDANSFRASERQIKRRARRGLLA